MLFCTKIVYCWLDIFWYSTFNSSLKLDFLKGKQKYLNGWPPNSWPTLPSNFCGSFNPVAWALSIFPTPHISRMRLVPSNNIPSLKAQINIALFEFTLLSFFLKINVFTYVSSSHEKFRPWHNRDMKDRNR